MMAALEVIKWTTTEVTEWLCSVGLEHYQENFKGTTLLFFIVLTDADLGSFTGEGRIKVP